MLDDHERTELTNENFVIWLNAAVDWAEKQDITHEIVRCSIDGWIVNLTIPDPRGKFYVACGPVPRSLIRETTEAGESKRPMSLLEYRDHIGLKMSRTIAQTRANRMASKRMKAMAEAKPMATVTLLEDARARLAKLDAEMNKRLKRARN